MFRIQRVLQSRIISIFDTILDPFKGQKLINFVNMTLDLLVR